MIGIITQPHLDLNLSRKEIETEKGRERKREKREKNGEIESETLTKSYLEEALRVENLAEGKEERCLSSLSSPLAGEPTTTSFSFSFFIESINYSLTLLSLLQSKYYQILLYSINSIFFNNIHIHLTETLLTCFLNSNSDQNKFLSYF